MARIRTIKPEFPQSESMGRVSRDARLCFIMIWTVCDDAGRVRGNSRMLASLLYPYDDDAPKKIGGWLDELEREGCIRRYQIGTDTYLESLNWLKHQKIDKPSASRIPPFDEASRILSKPLEPSAPDLVPSTGPRTLDQDLGRDHTRSASADVEPQEILALKAFNEVAKDFDWPLAQRMTDARKVKITQRLAECGGLDGWLAAMAKARSSPFLRGDTGRDKAHERWTPDLDFFLQQSTFTKLMEGKYDKRGRVQSTGFDALREGASRAAGMDGKRGEGMEGETDELHRLAISGGHQEAV